MTVDFQSDQRDDTLNSLGFSASFISIIAPDVGNYTIYLGIQFGHFYYVA